MGRMARVTLVTNRQLAGILARAGESGPAALAQALNEEGQLAFRQSQQMVPHADGDLQGSGKLTPATTNGTKVEVSISYGGSAAAYALRQHEDLSLTHPDPRNPRSRAAGEPKYLETPVRESVPFLQDALADRMRRILDGA